MEFLQPHSTADLPLHNFLTHKQPPQLSSLQSLPLLTPPLPPLAPRIAISCCPSLPQEAQAPPDSLNWPSGLTELL